MNKLYPRLKCRKSRSTGKWYVVMIRKVPVSGAHCRYHSELLELGMSMESAWKFAHRYVEVERATLARKVEV